MGKDIIKCSEIQWSPYLKWVNTVNFWSGSWSLLLAVGITAGRFPDLLGWYYPEYSLLGELYCVKGISITLDVSCVGLVCSLVEKWAVVALIAFCIGVALLHLTDAHTELVSNRCLQKQGSRKDYGIIMLSVSSCPLTTLFHEISGKSTIKFVGKPVLRQDFWLECDLAELTCIFQRGTSELPSFARKVERILVGWMCINVARNTFFVTEKCKCLEMKVKYQKLGEGMQLD